MSARSQVRTRGPWNHAPPANKHSHRDYDFYRFEGSTIFFKEKGGERQHQVTYRNGGCLLKDTFAVLDYELCQVRTDRAFV